MLLVFDMADPGHTDEALLASARLGAREAWGVLIARHQRHVTIDEIFLAEDICYNHGPLCSPAARSYVGVMLGGHQRGRRLICF